MIGQRVGSYEVIAKLGEGGMGEVYRARDTHLNRDVAIKVLPESFASDPDRLARFTREAQALAALNHPNIAQIYEAASTHIVMELVDGADLSHLAGRPMAWTELVPIARQIAEALETAHEQGIVHRDLKPANIKIRADGTVKVLDFGLAKIAEGADGGGTAERRITESPTLTARATQLGVILGTAAYMSPEQAKGKAIDKRADIWAFGVVMYELLTGRRAFEGDDVSTTLAAVLMKDPEWAALPAGTPEPLAQLIRRCLERDARQRLRDIGEARLLLSNPDALREPPQRGESLTWASSPPAARLAWVVAAAATLVAAILGWLWLSNRPGDSGAAPIVAAIAPPPGHDIGTAFALSPDGRRIVFEAWSKETDTTALWVRNLSNGTPTKLAGTEGATQPFWSPAGDEIAFFADSKLKKVDLQGAPPQVVCNAPSARGGAWGPDGTIVFSGSFRAGLEKVSSSGGKPTPLTTLDTGRKEKSHRWPVFLPGGTHLLFLAQTGEATAKDDESTIEALEFATAKRTPLIKANSSPLYSTDGFLLFWREGALRGQAFDAAALSVSGPVFSIASGVAFDSNEFASATVAGKSLVYLVASGVSRSNLVVLDRSGRTLRTVAESVLNEGGLALFGDSKLAVSVTASGARDIDIWLYDLARGTVGKVTFDEGNDIDPVWSADGNSIYYANSNVNDGIIYRRFADGRGQAEKIAQNQSGLFTFGASRTSDWLLLGAVTGATSFDLFRWDVASQTLSPLANAPANEDSAALSPDGRWVAYASDESGRYEIYVRSAAGAAGRWGVSTEGGFMPQWRADSRELYYVSARGLLMAAGIEAGPTFRTSAPKELFRANFRGGRSKVFAPFPDGQKFVASVVPDTDRLLLTLVTNFRAPN